MYLRRSVDVVIVHVRDFGSAVPTNVAVFLFTVTPNVFVLDEAVLDVFLPHFGLGRGDRLFPAISLVVEFLEEEEEHHSVHANPPYEGTGVVAVDEQQLEGVDHYRHELHLHK